MSEAAIEKRLFERANSLLKTHGIVSIVFGSLGVLAFIVWVLFASLSFFSGELSDVLGVAAISMIFGVIFLVPHVYLIIAGVQLLRTPSPKLARTLVIINLVIGVFWNIVLLVLAIVNLTQISDYERHLSTDKK